MNSNPDLSELIDRFDLHFGDYKHGTYNETQLRRDYLDPLLVQLGWDVDNSAGHAEAYRDVYHEDALKIGANTKSPDYSCRIGGTRKFFIEAKKPAVDIKHDPAPAFQLRRYAWTAKLPLSIVTNFAEFAVYDCRVRPHQGDKSSVARIHYWTYKEFISQWEAISGVFSKQAVLRGSFDKYALTAKGKKGTTEVDSAFLDDIESWRENLAKDIARNNTALSQDALNWAVQQIIDRIVFLRIAEDRGLEPYGQLNALLKGPHVYGRLTELFVKADARYNSGLFHFKVERGRSAKHDSVTPDLRIEDKTLKEILKGLYYPESPYEFSVLGADILGSVYERFLGKVIRLTAGHLAKVEDKPAVRKAGGVYYTPVYVVDYIVNYVMSRLLAKRTPKTAATLRVIDPACGSGSFLIVVYQYLLDWHRDWYVSDGPEKHSKGKQPAIQQLPNGLWRLTTRERKSILLNNVYGVDIDSQAVEVTKLSLLLKVLEGESQLEMFHERVLPDLDVNIKCGNSLVGTDFYSQTSLEWDSEAMKGTNAFDWSQEFKDIIRKGGFDAVVGNPPWGASFEPSELDYLRERYARVISRTVDSYIYFIDKAVMIARPNAPVGFIVPSTILNQVDTNPVRRILSERGISALINLGQGVFGSAVLNTSTIIVSDLDSDNQFAVANLAHLKNNQEKARSLECVPEVLWSDWKREVIADPNTTFFLGDTSHVSLLSRLRKIFPPLSSHIEGSIQRGLSPDIVEAHVLSDDKLRGLSIETPLLKASISGSQIKRYHPYRIDQTVLYTHREMAIDNFPRARKYLESFRGQNTCKEVTEGKHPWWCLHRARDPAIFLSPKLIGLTTSKTIELVFDEHDQLYVTDAMYVFKLLPDVDPMFFMAVIQSKLFLFLYRVSNQGESRVIPQIKASKLDPLPVPGADGSPELSNRITDLSKRLHEVGRAKSAASTPAEREPLQRQLQSLDDRLDDFVYSLYGLSEHERGIVDAEMSK